MSLHILIKNFPYLCNIKINEMIAEKLIAGGFIESDTPNEYTKGGWIIRVDGDLFEIFNDPDKGVGKYYISSSNIIDLEQILAEI